MFLESSQIGIRIKAYLNTWRSLCNQKNAVLWPICQSNLGVIGNFSRYHQNTGDQKKKFSNVASHWSVGVQGYSAYLSIRSFGLEENGDYDLAEECGRMALNLDPTDCWGAHAVAHVQIMQGRLDDGISWLTELNDNWSAANHISHHLWWHLALFHTERGAYDAGLDIYDNRLRNLDSASKTNRRDTLNMLHVSLRTIGQVERGPCGLLEAILGVLTVEGTLMMLVGSKGAIYDIGDMSEAEKKAALKERIAFDPNQTPANPGWGVIGETLRNFDKAYRSRHPDYSFAAVGRMAKELVAERMTISDLW